MFGLFVDAEDIQANESSTFETISADNAQKDNAITAKTHDLLAAAVTAPDPSKHSPYMLSIYQS
jgi:hypothetical protein